MGGEEQGKGREKEGWEGDGRRKEGRRGEMRGGKERKKPAFIIVSRRYTVSLSHKLVATWGFPTHKLSASV